MDMKQIADKKAYKDVIEPYMYPNGLVDVWSSIRKGPWKRYKLIHVPAWVRGNNNVDVLYTVQQYRIHPKVFNHPHDEPYYAPLFFDFDGNIEKDDGKCGNQALEEAKADTLSLCNRLINMINVDSSSLRIWFSGSKGFHVTVDGRIFGIMPNPKIHLLYKYIAYYYSKLLDLKTLDLGVYSCRRQWRIPGSKRKNGVEIDGELVDQYKVEISFSELNIMSITDIRKKASVNPECDQCNNYKEVDPSDVAMEWISEFIAQYKAQERLVESRARKKIVVPKDSTGMPKCIEAIKKYEFAKNRRNRAAIILSTFYNNIGIPLDEAEKKIVSWTELIPWEKKKIKERIANGRAVLYMVYDNDDYDKEGNKYRFTCQYVRAIGGTHYTGKEIAIPCTFEQCKFVEDVTDQAQANVISGTLLDVQRAEYFMKKIRCVAHIIGFGDKPYSIPLRVKVTCSHVESNIDTHQKFCEMCSMPNFADNRLEGEILREPYVRTVPIDPLRYGLSFVNISDNMKRGLIRAISGIFRECKCWSYEEESKGTLREVILRTSITSDALSSWADKRVEKEKVDRQMAFMVHAADDDFFTGCNLDVELIGIPVSSPKDQSIYFAITEISDGYSELDKFKMTKELYEQLKDFRVGLGESIWDKLKERCEYLGNNVTLIRDRFFLHLAVDLVYHSLPHLKLGEKDKMERGMMQLLIVGDPSQGKSDVPRYLRNHYDLGKFHEGSSTGRTGLLYTIDVSGKTRLLRWGALPQQDMRLIIVDEFQQVDIKDREQLTGPRTHGIVEVSRAMSGTAFARARMIFSANPGNSTGRVEGYNYGVNAITSIFPKQQDVRRLDAALLLRGGEVDLDKVNMINREDDENKIYTSSNCHNLLLWAWTRTADKIVWDELALEKLFEYSTAISKLFECDISLAEAHDMRYRLGRIAQAVAAMVFSTDSVGDKIYIFKEHVTIAAEFMRRTLSDVGKMHLDMYAVVWRNMNRMTDKQERSLKNMFLINGWFAGFAEKMLSVNIFTKMYVEDACGISDNSIFRDIWKFLFDEYMIISKGNAGYAKSPKFTTWLRDRLSGIISVPTLNL